MAQPQGLSPETEARMVEAHREGMRRAYEVFAIAIKETMDAYPGDHEARFAYLVGLIQELRRLAARTQTKGFRISKVRP